MSDAGWKPLLDGGLRRGGEARFLVELVEHAESVLGASIGLYGIGDSVARRQSGCGGGLPVEIELPGPGEGWVEIGADLGVLVEPPTAVGKLSPPMAAAIASAAHAATLAEQLKRQRFEVAQRGVQLEALYDVGLAIASTRDPALLSDEILLRAVSLLDARRGGLYLAESEGYALRQTLGGDAVSALSKEDADALSQVESARPPDLVDVLPDSEYVLAVPIEVDGARRGLLVVGDKESRRGVGPFDEADARTLSLFANQAGIALQNADLHRQALEKERLESELELAADIQRQLLPATTPELPGYEVRGWNRSARHVGGDYYDLIETDTGLTLLLADVSGKGMPAALLVSTLHSAFCLLTAGRPISPEVIERLNEHIFGSSAPNKFITLFAADLDVETGVVSYISAGHNPPVHVSPTGRIELLQSSGLPIGMLAGAKYSRAEVALEPGDLLCVYSDGMTECENAAGEELGEDRLAELVAEHRARPLAEIITELDRATTDFAGDVQQADDQTVVLLRRDPDASTL